MRNCMWAGAQAQAQNQAQPGPLGCQPSSQQANSQEGPAQNGDFFLNTSRYGYTGHIGVLYKTLKHV